MTGNDGRLGCRVPCVLIGPRARRNVVEKRQYDPNSILNMIAWRFGFEPLGARASSNNMALALDFSKPANLDAPAFDVPFGPFGQQCVPFGFVAGQLPLPIQVPGAPAPVCVPAAAATTFEPIPGFDVPLPSGPGANQAATVKAQRRIDHEQELEDLRALGRQHGFAVGS